jgi:hypothetical protein
MPRKSRKRKQKPRSVPVVYRIGEETIRYVDQPADLLPNEVTRLLGVMREIQFLLAKVGRAKHPLVEYVRFQTAAATILCLDPTTLTTAQCCQEIGRLNRILQDSLQIIRRFTTPFPFIDQATFRLQYGQTSKKREAGWNSFKRDQEQEAAPEPEVDSEAAPVEG